MEVPSIFLNRILTDAAKNGASNLHFAVGSVPMVRVHGKLMAMENEDAMTVESIDKIIELCVKGDDLEKLKTEKEAVLIESFGNNLRFRVDIFYQKGLPSLVFNYISGEIKPWESVDLPNQIKSLVNAKSGLFVVAGPNSSGRTSTISAFIEDINKNQHKYIVTLENPVEQLFVNKKSIIEQRQVGRDVETYIEGLEHCLKEDVDLVYIDETVKDFESIVPIVLALASGNCFVVWELNAENAIRAVEKIISAGDKGAIRYNLADVLLGVLVQRLIPKIGGGMAMAVEILLSNPAVRSLVREGNVHQLESIIQTSREEGMISMSTSIRELLNDNTIQKDEVARLNIDL